MSNAKSVPVVQSSGSSASRSDVARGGVLVGRDAEHELLHDELTAAARGVPRVVLVHGDAGIGKSSLLRSFLSEVRGAETLALEGHEPEADVELALVDQVLRATGSTATVLAARVNHVDAGLALLERFGELQAAAPVVIAIDDAHWVDSASVRALGFAVRRLTTERLLVVLAAREDEEIGLPESLIKLVENRGAIVDLHPLDGPQLAELAQRHGIALSPRELRRFRELTSGSPLHARALLEEVSPDDWLDAEFPTPAPRSLALLVRRRLAELPRDPRAILEAMAVLATPCDMAGAAYVAGVPSSDTALQAAAATRLLSVRPRPGGPWMAFTSPLHLAAAYDQLDPARRAEMHRRAAAVSDDPGIALRHRAAAALGPDADLARELVAFARREADRGAWSSSASMLLAASSVIPGSAERERYRLEAVESMLAAGMASRARRLARDLERFEVTALREYVRGHLALVSRCPKQAQPLLERAWTLCDTVAQAEVAAKIALLLGLHWIMRLEPEKSLEWARRAASVAPAGSALLGRAVALAASMLAHIGRMDEARNELAARAKVDEATRQLVGVVLGRLDLVDGDLDAARRHLGAGTAAARRSGELTWAAVGLTYLALVEYMAGAWDEAVVSAQQATAVAEEAEHELVAFVCWPVVAIEASRGDWQRAERYASTAADHAADCEDHVANIALARAHIAAQRGRPDEVVAALEPLMAIEPRDVLDEPGSWPWQDLYANALVDLGRLAEADEFLRAHEARAEARGRPAPIARLARARGRLAAASRDEHAATAAFERSLAVAERAGLPYECALTELCYGEHLRRQNRRREAVARLTAAHERLTTLGARPALERCQRELEACGRKVSKRSDQGPVRLTPQERVIARLVAQGLSNREIASALMLSVRTVDYHLRNTFSKLDVRSRTQLTIYMHDQHASS